ncbi:uncharacterized protein TM35_001081090, partial [Trypanosoma theileri]
MLMMQRCVFCFMALVLSTACACVAANVAGAGGGPPPPPPPGDNCKPEPDSKQCRTGGTEAETSSGDCENSSPPERCTKKDGHIDVNCPKDSEPPCPQLQPKEPAPTSPKEPAPKEPA